MKSYFRNRTLGIAALGWLIATGTASYAPDAHAVTPAFIYGNNAGSGSDRVEKFDIVTGALLQTYFPSTGNGRGVVVVGNVVYTTVVGDSNIYMTDATTGAPLGFIPTSLVSMSTLAWDGSTFWTTDYSGSNQGYQLDTAGNVLKTLSFSLATGFMDGMEWFNDKLIVNRTDGGFGGQIVYDVYDLNGNLLQANFISSLNGTGIAFDGTNFYVSDIRNNEINIYDGVTGAFISKLSLPGTHLIEDLSVDYAQRVDTGCTLVCPPDVTTSNDPGQCGAIVNYPPPGGCTNATVSCSPAPGSFFPVGTTVVTCNASDALNNVISSCSFSVTVTGVCGCANDTQPPSNSYTVVQPFQDFQSPLRRVGSFQLFASDDCDPDPLIYIRDSVTGFVAGPFHNGDQVEIGKGPTLLNSQHAPAGGSNDSVIHLEGGARMYSVDSAGNTSPIIKVL